MAALTTTVKVIGINGFSGVIASGGLLSMSTATTACTFTCQDLANVSIFGYNPVNVTDQTITISASTALRYAGKGIGDYTLTTALGSSDYFFAGNLESARFASSAKTFVITATTTILIAAWENTSTRCK